MFLHQIVLNGTFYHDGFRPVSFLVQAGEEYHITNLKYREYWKYGLEKYVCVVKGQIEYKEIFYDKNREKWFVKVENAIDKDDIPINY